MITIAPWRLNLLRCGYLLIAIGLGMTIWPGILDTSRQWELMHGVVISMLGALSLLAVLGVRNPLKMLPLLFFELAWKTIWLLRVALPLWTADKMDADTTETAFACLMVVVLPPVIPWDHVVKQFVRTGAEPWWRRAAA